MKLPIPFQHDGETITDFEVKTATARDIAATSRAVSEGQSYGAIRKWTRSALTSLNGNDDPAFLDNALRDMPFHSAYTVGCFGIAKTRGFDSVSATYRCPKCGAIRVYEATDDMDNADHLYQIEIDPDPELSLNFEFAAPIVLKNKTGKVLAEVSALTMRHPSVMDYIKAEQRFPDDDGRLSFFAYGCATTHINGQEVAPNWSYTLADIVFADMPLNTINRITRRLMEHAFGQNIERVCMKCHNRWTAPLNLNNFFASGLQG
jgi:hypothetical protein